MKLNLLRVSTLALGALAISSFSAAASAQVMNSASGDFEAVVVSEGLEHPWALAFLPDGRMLVTERGGDLRMVSPEGTVSGPVTGVPEVVARGQGGLLDVVLHPDYAENGWIYLTYSRASEEGARTAVARARLAGAALSDVETIFVAENPGSSGGHFGSRLAFAPDGTLYVSLGDRNRGQDSQNLSNHNGTILRLNDDGSIPEDNPFVDQAGALASTFSFGHRNPQGMAVHPERGEVWAHEHGPQGGDEINLLKPGVNYGWPVVTYGRSYAGLPIGEGSSKPGMEPPLHHWTPSIAPSGMAFYTGDAFPAWQGNLFVGSLKFRNLVRVVLDGTRVVEQEVLLEDAFGRIRDVRQGPDGLLYVLTDDPNGRLIRLQPVSG